MKFYENKSWNRNVTLKAINGKCTPECPTGYTEDISNKYKCVNCKGECPKSKFDLKCFIINICMLFI